MNTYINCKLYGPYTSKQDGRMRVIVVFPDGRKKTISYPKYLVEMYLDRYLDEEETVDHIDSNFSNNDLSNLRVVKRAEHSFQDADRNEDVSSICTWCNNEFFIKGSTLRQRNRRNASGFCSRKCSGQYGASVRKDSKNSLNTTIEFDKVQYKQKSRLGEILNVTQQNIGESLTRYGDGNTEA